MIEPRAKEKVLRLFSSLVVTACAAGATLASQAAVSAARVPPARDGNIAIREELDAARRAGTVEAYELFIARHPQHPLAEMAREELRRLTEREARR